MEVVACLTFFIFLKAAFSCNVDWVQFDGICYLIYKDALFNYTHAEDACSIRGSSLASVSSSQVLDFLNNVVGPDGQSPTSVGYSVWVGVTSSNSDEYTWNDGTNATGEEWFTNPDKKEDDAFSFILFSGKVQYQHPSILNGFICSQADEDTCTSKPNESDLEESGKCILYLPTVNRTRDEAAERCFKTEHHLPNWNEIFDEDWWSLIQSQVNDHTEDTFIWSNLTYQEYQEAISRQLLENKSFIDDVSSDSRNICIIVGVSNHRKPLLRPVSCHSSFKTVCVRQKTPASHSQPLQIAKKCPVGLSWVSYKDDCFWETSFEMKRRSWDEAQLFCRAFGGDIASLHSEEEEQAALNMQHGKLDHNYWIGLRLNTTTAEYGWSDNTTVDYLNWAPGHPNHRDMMLGCVTMDSLEINWIPTFCGAVGWFVCRVPARYYHPPPNLPTPDPLVACDNDDDEDEDEDDAHEYYYDGYCYSAHSTTETWHRAKTVCGNSGSSLASVHSIQELTFLLKLLYEKLGVGRGSRVWIGLNTLHGDSLRWSDYSVVDFVFWNENEPNNIRNQEKCCNMNSQTGMWSDDNCNNRMSFICKRRFNATAVVIPSTPDPLLGNCKKGWYPHADRCYYPEGKLSKNRANWTEASRICQGYGGYLASIRNANDQAFLAYIMQDLGNDTWIGLHDHLSSGRYYWTDNSDMSYSNWAPGQPSFLGILEDCVKMVYNSFPSGVWKDDECGKEYAYICQAEKDPNVPKPEYDRGLHCLQPEGWLKLGEQCFIIHDGIKTTWIEAERACQRENSHLVSLSTTSVDAVANYLGAHANQTFWIGLRYSETEQKVSWLNSWPVMITRWGKQDPAQLTQDSCFARSPDGFWMQKNCNEELSFMCHITAGRPPPLMQYEGNCPDTSPGWIPSENSGFCFQFGKTRSGWLLAILKCFGLGGTLISIHSIEEAESIKSKMSDSQPSFFIGLFKHGDEGFSWMDNSPVDFINWDEGQPQKLASIEAELDFVCVEMMADTLRWRVTPCQASRHFICGVHKEKEVFEYFLSEKHTNIKIKDTLPASTLTVIAILVVLAIVTGAAGVLFCRNYYFGRSPFRNPFRHHSMSFENALYNVDSASMQFEEDKVTATTTTCDT